jgi:hypothetical protein
MSEKYSRLILTFLDANLRSSQLEFAKLCRSDPVLSRCSVLIVKHNSRWKNDQSSESSEKAVFTNSSEFIQKLMYRLDESSTNQRACTSDKDLIVHLYLKLSEQHQCIVCLFRNHTLNLGITVEKVFALLIAAVSNQQGAMCSALLSRQQPSVLQLYDWTPLFCAKRAQQFLEHWNNASNQRKAAARSTKTDDNNNNNNENECPENEQDYANDDDGQPASLPMQLAMVPQEPRSWTHGLLNFPDYVLSNVFTKHCDENALLQPHKFPETNKCRFALAKPASLVTESTVLNEQTTTNNGNFSNSVNNNENKNASTGRTSNARTALLATSSGSGEDIIASNDTNQIDWRRLRLMKLSRVLRVCRGSGCTVQELMLSSISYALHRYLNDMQGHYCHRVRCLIQVPETADKRSDWIPIELPHFLNDLERVADLRYRLTQLSSSSLSSLVRSSSLRQLEQWLNWDVQRRKETVCKYNHWTVPTLESDTSDNNNHNIDEQDEDGEEKKQPSISSFRKVMLYDAGQIAEGESDTPISVTSTLCKDILTVTVRTRRAQCVDPDSFLDYLQGYFDNVLSAVK